MKVLWVQMIDLYLVFRFVEGRWHSNQLIFGKFHERRLIPLAFFALSFENELQYHCLNVRLNSGNNVAISCKNLVNFCRVTPEKMELIWERQVRQDKNRRISLNISRHTGRIFAIYSPYESALRADDGSVPYFPICQGTLQWQLNNVATIMKANWYYVHSLHVCQMVAGFGLLLLARRRHCGAERAIR